MILPFLANIQLTSSSLLGLRKALADIAENSTVSVQELYPADWNAEDQNLVAATLMATPTQRIAWLEEALQLAYATGALKPRRMLTKEEWDAMGKSAR
jgi:hypothetical protein